MKTRTWKGEIIWEHPGRPNATTRVLRRERQESREDTARLALPMEGGVPEPRKGQLTEAGKGEETDSSPRASRRNPGLQTHFRPLPSRAICF